MGGKSGRKKGVHTAIYEFYRGDELLAEGTVIEIAEKLGVNKTTIWWYGNNSYIKKLGKRKMSKNARLLIRVDKDCEDDMEDF